MKRQVDAIQWGGGVVAEFLLFPCSPKADAIQWRGGSSRIFTFSVLSESQRDSVGGGGSTMNLSLMGPFYIFDFSKGGPGPLGPPP